MFHRLDNLFCVSFALGDHGGDGVVVEEDGDGGEFGEGTEDSSEGHLGEVVLGVEQVVLVGHPAADLQVTEQGLQGRQEGVGPT